MVPTTALPGQGRLCVLNSWGGVCASCLWGWHPGREETGMPQADSVGWDMPVPVPMPVPSWAGRERKGGVLCRGPGTRWALQGATVWVVVQGRRWQQPWHRVLAGLLGEVGAVGYPGP